MRSRILFDFTISSACFRMIKSPPEESYHAEEEIFHQLGE
jgi:hypothetical protein